MKSTNTETKDDSESLPGNLRHVPTNSKSLVDPDDVKMVVVASGHVQHTSLKIRKRQRNFEK